MKSSLTIFIGFVHDFAAGCWAASVAALYWLQGQNLGPELLMGLADLRKRFFYAGLACILIVMITGAGRTFTYVDNVYGAEAEQKRKKMLIVKHLLLLIVFGCGTYWQYRMAFGP